MNPARHDRINHIKNTERLAVSPSVRVASIHTAREIEAMPADTPSNIVDFCARYTRAADQRRMATAAMDKAKAGISIGKPSDQLAKRDKSPELSMAENPNQNPGRTDMPQSDAEHAEHVPR